MGVPTAPRGVKGKDKTAHNKREAVRLCQWLGHDPRSHDEAEAVLIAMYIASMRNPRLAAGTTPLFAGKGPNE